jgi:hypothetical protein
MRYPAFIEADFDFPEFFRVRMHFDARQIQDVNQAVNRELDAILPASGIRPGDRVAVGVGSRGIDQLAAIVQAVCGRLQELGARPAIIPAMGSHGGATAKGQAAVLERLGVTEAACGAPVVSSWRPRASGPCSARYRSILPGTRWRWSTRSWSIASNPTPSSSVRPRAGS